MEYLNLKVKSVSLLKIAKSFLTEIWESAENVKVFFFSTIICSVNKLWKIVLYFVHVMASAWISCPKDAILSFPQGHLLPHHHSSPAHSKAEWTILQNRRHSTPGCPVWAHLCVPQLLTAPLSASGCLDFPQGQSDGTTPEILASPTHMLQKDMGHKLMRTGTLFGTVHRCPLQCLASWGLTW